MQDPGRIRTGTSGWSYRHWQGDDRFYPPGLPRRRELAYYAERFSSTEINGTFYNLPAARTLTRWTDETPDDFLFTAKLSRYLMHMKKLKEPRSLCGGFTIASASSAASSARCSCSCRLPGS